MKHKGETTSNKVRAILKQYKPELDVFTTKDLQQNFPPVRWKTVVSVVRSLVDLGELKIVRGESGAHGGKIWIYTVPKIIVPKPRIKCDKLDESEAPVKISVSKIVVAKLQEMKDKGITKFTAYDLCAKYATKRDINNVQTKIYDLCQFGEVKVVKKVRPVYQPDIVVSKVYINQYEFANWGQPMKEGQKAKDKLYRTRKMIKNEEVAKGVECWNEVWPDMFSLPEFKSQNVSVTYLGA